MVSTPTQPRERLRSLLDAVRTRWRTQAVLRVLGRAAFAASMPVAGAAIAARALSLDGAPLSILVATTFVASTAAAILVAFRSGAVAIVRRPSDVRVARFIEERVAEERAAAVEDASSARQPLNDVLVSAVEQSHHADDIGFRALVIASAADRLAAISPDRIIPRAAIRRASFEAFAGVAVFAIAFVFAMAPLGRAVDRALVALFPGSVSVHVYPGDARVRPGGSVIVSASVTSRGRAAGTIAPVLTIESSAGRELQTVAMSRLPTQESWSAVIPVEGSFRYRVTAGPARSAEYTVTALMPPRAERIELDYKYPAFTRLPPRHEEDGGDIYAPSGTTVRVRVHTDKAVASGRLTLAGAEAAALTPTSERILEGEIVLSKDDSYRVALADAEGLGSAGETEYFIRVMDDRPPDVRIVRPAGDQQITPLEEMAIEARADDDHGIAKLELVYAVAGRDPKVVPLATRPAGESQQAGSHVIAAEDLRVQPGDVISYYARARDVARGKPSSETRSDMFFLEVRPFSEEFVSAQSQGMAGANADQIEGLIAAQKEIINATWSIERRAASGAGRSSADIAAIAGAQNELKARAEQMAPNRGRPARYPLQVQPPAGPAGVVRQNRTADPVSTAISAMGRAVDHLQGQKPADALTHEMAALQALLQAQAEIRRREVGQASAGGAGMGRQGQDLSALFDKELQRQQRTNYETQSRAEQGPDRADHQSALDRIRDLARRQEALSEQQRALANGALAEEERKRQLEKLKREQETLRQQTDDLARQLGQQPRSGLSDADTSARQASEQMRGAAGDLQRQDAAGAAERAGRAAAQLRRLEQQMQGNGPDAKARAAAELRMEAQQIADEQQRIAGEAERLDKGATENKGSADTDAMRRLAGEKDKLADRVDELRKSAAGLGKELDAQQIATRMRETAQQMREQGTGARAGRSGTGSAPRKLADAEQQIAQALARALDRLDGSRDGVGEISRALDQTRRMREQLDSVEQRLRQAEAKAARGSQGKGRGPSGQRSCRSGDCRAI